MKSIAVCLLFLVANAVLAQTNLPLIRATSKQVSIKDGAIFEKNAWSLSPGTKPDVYDADRTRQTKWVTFYTDIDSIRIKLKPGTFVDFIVLLNGKDSCYTRVASAISAETGRSKNSKTSPDIIPFVLTNNDAIQVNGIVNETDTVKLHFDVGSTDFRLSREAILNRTSLLPNRADVLAGKATANYTKLAKVNQIQLGKLVFSNPTFVPVALAARDMDGRFGYNVFEGRVVEIDYDKSLLLIHSVLPKNLTGYVKSSINFIRSAVCIEATIPVGGKTYTGNFLVDTGSDMAMILDSVWAAKRNFPTDLPVLKVASFKDGRGKKFEVKTVIVPELRINKTSLFSIPTSMLGSNTPVGYEVNCFGNAVLKRFNTILDFQKDQIYLKPNKWLKTPFKGES